MLPDETTLPFTKQALRLAIRHRRAEEPQISRVIGAALDLVYFPLETESIYKPTAYRDENGDTLYRKLRKPNWRRMAPYLTWVINRVNVVDRLAILVYGPSASMKDLDRCMKALAEDGFDFIVFNDRNPMSHNTVWVAYHIGKILPRELQRIVFDYTGEPWSEFQRKINKLGLEYWSPQEIVYDYPEEIY